MGDCMAVAYDASMVAKGGDMQQTIVKKYKGERKCQKDAEKMARAGFRVVSVADQGKPGWRWLVGPVWVKRRILVTYARDG